MKVTYIIRNLTEDCLSKLKNDAPSASFDWLNKQAFGDLKHCVSQKIGTGQFRDRVELNQILRAPKGWEFKMEPRRGYTLATFEIQ